MLAELKKHAMTAISFLIPVVVAAGFLLAIGSIGGGNAVTDFSKSFGIFDAFSTMGSLGLGLLPIVIATGISFSIADKPGIAPGIIIGLISKAIGAGFFGGFIGGYIAGYITKFIVKNLKVPSWAEGLKPMLIIPLISSAICGLLMFFVIGVPVRTGTALLDAYLKHLNGSSKFIYGMVIGILSSIDYGGAINKVVYAFVLGLLSEGVKEPVTVLMIASMVTPFGMTMAYFIQKIFRKNIYEKEEVENLKAAFPMGICMITEGCLPIVMNDIVRCVIATGVGGAIGGGFSMLWGADSAVPHGGVFAIVTMHHPWAFLGALFLGSLATAIVLVITKKDIHLKTEGTVKEAEISDSNIKIS